MTPLLLLGAVAGGWVTGWWPVRQVADAHRRSGGVFGRQARWGFAAVCALAFAAVVWGVGLSPLLPVALVFTAAGLAAAAVDLVEHRLPNAILLPAFLTIVVGVLAVSLIDGWHVAGQALAGGSGMLALYGVVALLSPRSMGMGDVKLAAVIGVTLGAFGITAWAVGLLGAFLVGGVVAIVTLVRGRAGLASAIPFGPSMVAGAIAGLLLA